MPCISLEGKENENAAIQVNAPSATFPLYSVHNHFQLRGHRLSAAQHRALVTPPLMSGET